MNSADRVVEQAHLVGKKRVQGTRAGQGARPQFSVLYWRLSFTIEAAAMNLTRWCSSESSGISLGTVS